MKNKLAKLSVIIIITANYVHATDLAADKINIGPNNTYLPAVDSGEYTVFGDTNIVQDHALAVGYGNTSYWGSYVMGNSNISYTTDPENILGMDFLFGQSNLSKDSIFCFAFGISNQARNSSTAFMLGTSNRIESGDTDGTPNISIGDANYIIDTQNNEIRSNILIGLLNRSEVSSAWILGEGNNGQERTVTLGTYAALVDDPSLILGNGTGSTDRSNAITTFKNGQTVLTNKAWKANTGHPLDDPTSTTDAGGEAPVVEGHTRLKGKVIIEQPQGDISMGIYGN